MIFKIVSLFLAAYFIFAGAVQYNDPDPLHWMLLYFTSSLACILAAFDKDKLPLLYAIIGMAGIEIAATIDGFFDWLRTGNENLITAKMTDEKPYIELGREFLGALISIVVITWLWFRKRPKNSK